MQRVAILSVQQPEVESALVKLKGLAEPGAIRAATWLSSQGTHLNVGMPSQGTPHIYSPVNSDFKRVFILKTESSRLLPTNFTVAWLGHIVLDMGAGGEIFIEKCEPAPEILGFDLLKAYLPEGDLDIVDGAWIRLRWSEALSASIGNICTAYHKLHRSFEVFKKEWVGDTAQYDKIGLEKALRLATHHHLYSLKGINSKCFVLNRVIEDYIGDKRVYGYDMAGGFGFMAAELASVGHTMEVIDYDLKKAEVGKSFLAMRGLNNGVILDQGDARNIGTLNRSYDIFICFEALYAIGKENVPSIFRDAMVHMRDGGILVINEGALKGGRKPGAPFYDELFELHELIQCLVDNAGEPQFYDYKTGRIIARSELSEKGPITAVVRKGKLNG